MKFRRSKTYRSSLKPESFILLSRDVLWKIMFEMEIQDVISTCISNRSVSSKCTEKFWELYARNTLKYKGKNTFKSWHDLVTDLEISPTTELKLLYLKRNLVDIENIVNFSKYLEDTVILEKNSLTTVFC